VRATHVAGRLPLTVTITQADDGKYAIVVQDKYCAGQFLIQRAIRLSPLLQWVLELI